MQKCKNWPHQFFPIKNFASVMLLVIAFLILKASFLIHENSVSTLNRLLWNLLDPIGISGFGQLDCPSRNQAGLFATGEIRQNVKFAAFWCVFLTKIKVDPESW